MFKINTNLCIAIVLLLSGCGGGTGNKINYRPLSNKFRVLQPGDYWTYSIFESYHGGAGTATTTITKDSKNRLIETTSEEGDILTRILEQDLTTLDVKLVQIGSSAIINPPIVFQGNWKLPLSYEWTAEDVLITFMVEGQESLTVSAGNFVTWKTRQTQDTSDVKTVGTYWYAPDIGAWVKADYITTFLTGPYKGISYHYTASLSRTNTFVQE